jgi:hypothetical protein
MTFSFSKNGGTWMIAKKILEPLFAHLDLWRQAFTQCSANISNLMRDIRFCSLSSSDQPEEDVGMSVLDGAWSQCVLTDWTIVSGLSRLTVDGELDLSTTVHGASTVKSASEMIKSSLKGAGESILMDSVLGIQFWSDDSRSSVWTCIGRMIRHRLASSPGEYVSLALQDKTCKLSSAAEWLDGHQAFGVGLLCAAASVRKAGGGGSMGDGAAAQIRKICEQSKHAIRPLKPVGVAFALGAYAGSKHGEGITQQDMETLLSGTGAAQIASAFEEHKKSAKRASPGTADEDWTSGKKAKTAGTSSGWDWGGKKQWKASGDTQWRTGYGGGNSGGAAASSASGNQTPGSRKGGGKGGPKKTGFEGTVTGKWITDNAGTFKGMINSGVDFSTPPYMTKGGKPLCGDWVLGRLLTRAGHPEGTWTCSRGNSCRMDHTADNDLFCADANWSGITLTPPAPRD